MKQILGFIVIILSIILFGCNPMDSTYSKFLASGVITYAGKADSVKTHPGRNRVLVSWKPITDPRVTGGKIYWSSNKDSVVFPITSKADTTVLIENLSEGNYTFDFYTYDKSGARSLKVEVVGLVYGSKYESGLPLKTVQSVVLTNNVATITFNSLVHKDYAYQEITYTSSLTQSQKTIQVGAVESKVVINDYSGTEFLNRSVYKPSELSPDLFYSTTVTQYTPTVPLLSYPETGATGISCAPEFVWYNSVLLADATYTLEYSVNQSVWTSVVATKSGTFIPKTLLNPNTLYYWRVTASKKGFANQVSAIKSFTTGAKTLYADGETLKVQSNTLGLKPVRLAFTGDGFLQSDYAYGGIYDKFIDEAIDAFFSVEPYKSYRQYFEVWKVAAYSNESGISESDKSINLVTAFSSNYTGITITCSTSKVFEYIKHIPNVDDAALTNMATIVVLNKKRQGGVSYVTDDCKSIALCPVFRSSSTSAFVDFTNMVIKQGGGFCFGLLADETSSISGIIPGDQATKMKAEWAAGRSLNVDMTSDPTQVRWAHFIGRTGYTRPGVTEGAYGYKSGIYRSEITSCMTNGQPYFNAISRELIVKRILKIAGETYNLDAFIQKDVVKTPYD